MKYAQSEIPVVPFNKKKNYKSKYRKRRDAERLKAFLIRKQLENQEKENCLWQAQVKMSKTDAVSPGIGIRVGLLQKQPENGNSKTEQLTTKKFQKSQDVKCFRCNKSIQDSNLLLCFHGMCKKCRGKRDINCMKCVKWNSTGNYEEGEIISEEEDCLDIKKTKTKTDQSVERKEEIEEKLAENKKEKNPDKLLTKRKEERPDKPVEDKREGVTHTVLERKKKGQPDKIAEKNKEGKSGELVEKKKEGKTSKSVGKKNRKKTDKLVGKRMNVNSDPLQGEIKTKEKTTNALMMGTPSLNVSGAKQKKKNNMEVDGIHASDAICSKKQKTANIKKSDELHSSKLTTDEECNICNLLGKSEKVTCICVDCNDLLCADCSEKHKFSRFTVKHTVVTLTSDLLNKRRQNTDDCKDKMCTKHKELLSYFCEECICLACKLCLKDKHENHMCVDAEDTVVVKRKELELLQNGIREKIGNIKTDLSKGKKFLSDMNACQNETLKSLQSVVTTFQKKVCMEEKAATQTINIEFEKLKNAGTAKNQEYETVIACLEEVLTWSDVLLEKDKSQKDFIPMEGTMLKSVLQILKDKQSSNSVSSFTLPSVEYTNLFEMLQSKSVLFEVKLPARNENAVSTTKVNSYIERLQNYPIWIGDGSVGRRGIDHLLHRPFRGEPVSASNSHIDSMHMADTKNEIKMETDTCGSEFISEERTRQLKPSVSEISERLQNIKPEKPSPPKHGNDTCAVKLRNKTASGPKVAKTKKPLSAFSQSVYDALNQNLHNIRVYPKTKKERKRLRYEMRQLQNKNKKLQKKTANSVRTGVTGDLKSPTAHMPPLMNITFDLVKDAICKGMSLQKQSVHTNTMAVNTTLQPLPLHSNTMSVNTTLQPSPVHSNPCLTDNLAKGYDGSAVLQNDQSTPDMYKKSSLSILVPGVTNFSACENSVKFVNSRPNEVPQQPTSGSKLQITLDPSYRVDVKTATDQFAPIISGVACMGSEKFAVSDSINSKIKVYSTTGELLDEIQTFQPKNISFVHGHLVWSSRKNVFLLNIQTKKISSFGIPGEVGEVNFHLPHPVFGKEGSIFVGNGDHILEYSFSKHCLVRKNMKPEIRPGVAVEKVMNIAGGCDKDQQLIVCDWIHRMIVVTNRTGKTTGIYSEVKTNPKFLPMGAFCPKGQKFVFVLDAAGNRLLLLNNHCKLVQEWSTLPAVTRPWSLTGDNSNLFISGCDQYVNVFQYSEC